MPNQPHSLSTARHIAIEGPIGVGEKDALFANLTLDDDEQRLYRPVYDSIDDDYLTRFDTAYMNFFHHYAAAPVMVVNSQNLNFTDRGADFQLLIQRIVAMRGHREYFNRGE